MPDIPLNLAEIERRIAAVRQNLAQLEEQAAAVSGAADEELASRRIADQEAQLEILNRQRDELLQSRSGACASDRSGSVHVVTVDRAENGRIRLANADSGEGRHKGHHRFMDLGAGRRGRRAEHADVGECGCGRRPGRGTFQQDHINRRVASRAREAKPRDRRSAVRGRRGLGVLQRMEIGIFGAARPSNRR